MTEDTEVIKIHLYPLGNDEYSHEIFGPTYNVTWEELSQQSQVD